MIGPDMMQTGINTWIVRNPIVTYTRGSTFTILLDDPRAKVDDALASLHRRLAWRRRWFGWAAWLAWRLSR